jgi:hypothetical protein
MPSLRGYAPPRAARGARQRAAYALWERCISEIVPDFWWLGKLGISTLGQPDRRVSPPAWLVFRLNVGDLHPTPWIRVKLGCAFGDATYPHPQWSRLAALWKSLYHAGQDAFTVTVDGSKIEFAPGVLPQISGETLTLKERFATGADVTEPH